VGSLALRILAEHSGVGAVEPGEIVYARVDKVMINDVTGPMALSVLADADAEDLVNPEKVEVHVVMDHYSPPHNWDSANAHRRLRDFARKHRCVLHDVGSGVAHQLLAEGIVKPGDLVVGADSHTLTYGALSSFATGIGSSEAAYAMATGELWFKAPEPLYVEVRGRFHAGVTGKDLALYLLKVLGPVGALYRSVEFVGSSLRHVSMPDKLTVANMMVEAGAKTAIFPYDDVTEYWLRMHGVMPERMWRELTLDPGGPADIEVDLSELEPLIAEPPMPTRVRRVTDLEGTEVDLVFVGSCTNGRYEDMVALARLLKGRRVRTRLIVIPASVKVLKQMTSEGVLNTLLEAGAVIGVPGCGPCFGAHMGVAGDGEVVVSTANRNFPGRAGPPTAKVYLASPYTAAAAALTGRITDPRPLLTEHEWTCL